MRGTWIVALALSGCFDFDRLRTPRDDLRVGGDDLGIAGEDLATTDLPAMVDEDLGTSSDLSVGDAAEVDQSVAPPDMRCPAGPTLTGERFFVRAGGGGDAGTSNAPFGRVSSAVSAALAQGGPAAVLIEEGTYDESVDITGGGGFTVTLLGGYHGDFECRDPATHPSRIRSASEGVAAVRADAPAVLDGLTLIGKLSTTSETRGLAILKEGVTVNNCTIRSHENFAFQTVGARGVVVAGVTTTITNSALESGPARDPIPDSQALSICSGAVNVNDTTLTSRGGGVSAYALGANAHSGCGTMLAVPSIFRRSRFHAENAQQVQAIRLSSNDGAIVSEILGCMITSTGAGIFFDGNAGENTTLQGTTIKAPYPLGANRGVGLTLIDSILDGTLPITANGSPSFVITANGKNLIHSTFFYPEDGGPPMVWDWNSGRVDIDGFLAQASGDDQSEFADPKLAASGALTAQSTAAIDRASGCVFNRDIDGETRPKNGVCDVGADER